MLMDTQSLSRDKGVADVHPRSSLDLGPELVSCYLNRFDSI